MKIVSTLLFILLFSESIYAVKPRLPGESYEDAQKRIQSNRNQNENSPNTPKSVTPYVPSLNDLANRNIIDVHGDVALAIISTRQTEAATPETAPQAVQTRASESKSRDASTAQQSVPSNPGYRPDVNDLVRRNILDMHGENAMPAPRAVQTQASDKEVSPADSRPGASHLLLPKDSVALHGILDGISRDAASARGGSSGGGPSAPDGKPIGGGGTFPPPPSSSGGSGGSSADVRGAPGETTYLDVTGRFWSAPKDRMWDSVAEHRQNHGTQFILVDLAADDARRMLESMNPDSAEARRLRCQLSFW